MEGLVAADLNGDSRLDLVAIAGRLNSVAVMMATQAMDTGKRQIYDGQKREIREG